LRKARRSSAHKKNSKLLVSHISRNLGHGLPNCIDCTRALLQAYNMAAFSWPLVVRFVVLLADVFADEFRVNPHFDLEPDYITRKGI